MPCLLFACNSFSFAAAQFLISVSFCRKPRLLSSATNTHLMRPSRASPPPRRRAPLPERRRAPTPERRRAPPPERRLRRSRPWLHPSLTQRCPSPRARPISCMRGGALILAGQEVKHYRRVMTVRGTQLSSDARPTFLQESRVSAAAPPLPPPPLSSPAD